MIKALEESLPLLISQYWPISDFSPFLMVGSSNVDVSFGLDAIANSLSSNSMSTPSSFFLCHLLGHELVDHAD